MRILGLFCILVLLSSMLGLGGTQPSGTTADEEPQQTLQLAYPLVRRWKLTALYDRTNPNDNFNLDNAIQIYTGATVRRDGNPPGDFVCDVIGNWQVCGYTDGDTSLWDLRWDQDHVGASGGPGWLWYDSHAGYDIASPTGQLVAAAGNGTAYHTNFYQPNGVMVDHPGVIYDTYYGHNAWRIANNTPVHYGTHIADSGQAGGGAHLHFGVKDSTLTPVDPGWEGGNLWAGGEPFPLGYIDQNNNPHGPFQLDDTKIRDKWLSVARRLGSPIEDDYTATCPSKALLATCRYQGFERGYIYYQIPYGSAQVVYFGQTFLPRIIASEDANAWNSTVSIRNLGGGQATVSLTFFTRDGRVLDSRVYNGLPANATWEVGVRGILYDQFLNRADSNPVFEGSAVVASDQDIAVIVRTERSNRVTAYTGLSSLDPGSGWGRPAASFYAPTVMWNAWGNWKSYLYLQNTTPEPANL